MTNAEQTQDPSPKRVLIPFSEFTDEQILQAVKSNLGIGDNAEELLKKAGVKEVQKKEGSFRISYLPNIKK